MGWAGGGKKRPERRYQVSHVSYPKLAAKQYPKKFHCAKMRPYSLPPELHLHQIQQSKYEDFFSRLSQYPTARLKKRKTWFHIFSIRMMSVN